MFQKFATFQLEVAPPILGGVGVGILGAFLGGTIGAVLGFIGGTIVTHLFWRAYLAIQDDGNDI